MKSILSSIIALVALFSFNVASAQHNTTQQPHFNNPPTTTDNGTTLTQCGSIYGLGNNELVTITISCPATITTTCTNPGGNVAPGQTKTGTLTASGQFTADKNGHVNYCLNTTEPAPGRCPNGQWTGTVSDVSFGAVTTLVNGKVIRGQ